MIFLQATLVLSGLGGALAALLLLAEKYLANYGECAVDVNGERQFSLEGGDTLLNALYENKIFIPSACGGQGTCGFCKVRVLEGGGPVLPTELPYLNAKELADSTRLACQVKIRKDLRVHVREDFLHVKEYAAEVSSARMLTPDTREIKIRLLEPSEMEFRAGQYVQVFVPKQEEPTFRAYSISSSPMRRDEIELVVRLIPGGKGSTYLHEVEPGDKLKFTGPYGEFKLDEAKDVVCVGGGCGMAPVKSIVEYCHAAGFEKEVWLFFGCRSDEHVMYLDEFQELRKSMPNLHIHYALSEPGEGSAWKGETGFIHECLEKKLDVGSDRQAFLCGPPVMIEATKGVLADKSISEENVFYDEF